MNIWGFTFIAITMMIFMQFAGFPTGIDPVLDFFGIDFNEDNSIGGFDINISDFWEYIFNSTTGLLATLLGTGIAIGLFATGRADIAIFAGIASAVLILFLPTIAFALIYAIENSFSAWVTGLLAIIFIPLSVGYLISLFKFIGGGN